MRYTPAILAVLLLPCPASEAAIIFARNLEQAGLNVPRALVRASFRIDLFDVPFFFPTPPFPGVLVAEFAPAPGIFTLAPGDAGFDALAGRLTDGRDDYISLTLRLNEEGGFMTGVGNGGHESIYLGVAPGTDLIGRTIDRFEWDIVSVAVASPGSDPNRDGKWTDFSFSWQFRIYGSGDPLPYLESLPAVPEPASLVMMAAGLMGVAVMARRRRASGATTLTPPTSAHSWN